MEGVFFGHDIPTRHVASGSNVISADNLQTRCVAESRMPGRDSHPLQQKMDKIGTFRQTYSKF